MEGESERAREREDSAWRLCHSSASRAAFPKMPPRPTQPGPTGLRHSLQPRGAAPACVRALEAGADGRVGGGRAGWARERVVVLAGRQANSAGRGLGRAGHKRRAGARGSSRC